MFVISFYSPSHLNYGRRMEQMLSANDIPHRVYTSDWLDRQEYYEQNKWLVDEIRGFRLWSWKPVIMLDALRYHDKVLYLDASVVIDDFDMAERYIEENKIVTAPPTAWKNYEWTAGSCFQVMKCEEEKYHNGTHVWAGCVAVSNSPETKQFLREWLYYCSIPAALKGDDAVENLPGFVQHRWDQSILSLMLIEYGYEPKPLPVAHDSDM